MTYISEKYQKGILTSYLDSEDFRYATEIELYSIPIDIVAENPDGDLYSIELKTKDWTRGLRQSERNRDFVDYSYLSVWKSYLTENLISRVKESKIGLLVVDEDVTCVESAELCSPNEYARDKLIGVLNDEI